MGKTNSIKIPSSIFIATFSLYIKGERSAGNGILDPMLYYFLPRVKKIYLLDQPYPGSDRISPLIEKYVTGKFRDKSKTYITTIILYPFLKIFNRSGTHLVFKIRDLFSVIEAGLRFKNKITLFIGLESINTIGGIILKKLGKVQKVVYYVSDFSPKRFKNKILNYFYLEMDRFCAIHADYIWDVSPAMHPARIEAGLNPNKSKKVILVPNALYKDQIGSIPYEQRQQYSCVYVGTVGLENGPDIAIKAMRYIVRKFPQSKLHFMGGGGKGFEEKYLKSLVKRYNLQKNIIFHGFISDQKKLSDIIKQFKIGLAPYKNIPGSIRLYGDATKIRLYMASGLPTITTNVPPLGKEVHKKGAAIIVKDKAEELANAIMSIFEDEKKGNNMAIKAHQFAKNNIWKNTYGNAFRKMGADYYR